MYLLPSIKKFGQLPNNWNGEKYLPRHHTMELPSFKDLIKQLNLNKKRHRKRSEEVERFYQCNYPSCTKAYGTLNHLNSHIKFQNHGPKRLPKEFKLLRMALKINKELNVI